MKTLKYMLGVAALAAITALGQTTTNAPTFIKGTLDIKYNTKSSDTVAKGVKDVYTLNINVANSAIFHGTISNTPQIIGGLITKSVTQPRSLSYDLQCDVVNPRNVVQTKNVGRLYGDVPIDSDGTYRYDKGNLIIDILPAGTAAGFTSKFDGTAQGKPMGRPANFLDTLHREAVSITRSVGGKVSVIVLHKYDQMDFKNHVLASGPVAIYPPVTVNGQMLYDYDKNCWFFNGITLQYADGGVVRSDRVTGTIRWVESPQRKVNGQGEYQCDIRVNEPIASATAAFDAKPADESAFFDTDTSVPGLTGTMKYKDTLRGDTTLASAVTIDLTGNNLTKQQAMALCKIIIFSSVVPMNSD